MLRLKNSNSQELALKHYAGIQFYLNQVLDFYINFFKLINNEIHSNNAIDILYNKSNLDDKTITKLGQSLGFGVSKKYKIKKNNISEVLNNPKAHLNKILYNYKSENIKLFKDLKDNLEDIIVSKPKELIIIESNFKNKYPFIVNNNGIFEEPIRNILLLNIFNYNKFSNKTGFPINMHKDIFWERYNLCQALNISTCAYCNRIFTVTVVNEKGKGVISPSIDHFFDKASHPFLALSFYNLIPSCTNCNSALKGITKFTLDKYIHPYLSGFAENGIFSYKALDTESALGESANLEIFIDIVKDSPLEIQISNNTSNTR